MDKPVIPLHLINRQKEALALGRQKDRALVEVYLTLKALVATPLFSDAERKAMLNAVVERLEVDVSDLSRLALEIRGAVGTPTGSYPN